MPAQLGSCAGIVFPGPAAPAPCAGACAARRASTGPRAAPTHRPVRPTGESGRPRAARRARRPPASPVRSPTAAALRARRPALHPRRRARTRPPRPAPRGTTLADRPDATVVRHADTVAKAHAPGTDPAALAPRLGRAAALPDVLLAPLAARPPPAARPPGDLLAVRRPGRPGTTPTPRPGRRPAPCSPGCTAPPPPAGAAARCAAPPRPPAPSPGCAAAGPHPAPRAVLRAWARAARLGPRRGARCPGRGALCHGDLHLGQLVRHPAPDGPWLLIDVDDLGVGVPAWDLARPRRLVRLRAAPARRVDPLPRRLPRRGRPRRARRRRPLARPRRPGPRPHRADRGPGRRQGGRGGPAAGRGRAVPWSTPAPEWAVPPQLAAGLGEVGCNRPQPDSVCPGGGETVPTGEELSRAMQCPKCHAPDAHVQPQRRPDRAVQRLPRDLPRLRRAGGADPRSRPSGRSPRRRPRRRRPTRPPPAARLGRPARRRTAAVTTATATARRPPPPQRASATCSFSEPDRAGDTGDDEAPGQRGGRGLSGVDDTGIEPVTSSVSGKRSPAELIVLGPTAGPAGVTGYCVRDTGIEPVTSSVSGKRSPAELIARVYSGS